jgi:hypothetical protein
LIRSFHHFHLKVLRKRNNQEAKENDDDGTPIPEINSPKKTKMNKINE